VRDEILLMLSPKAAPRPSTKGTSPAESRRRPQGRHWRGPGKVRAPPSAGRPRPRPRQGEGHWEETPILDDETAGQDTYEGHEIVLDDFVRSS
jgi:hypothetical protein